MLHSQTIFEDRIDAGQQLARALEETPHGDTVVLALPRGGIVPAAEVAQELEAPLGVILVRKIGHPYDPEYAVGALVDDQEPMYNTAEIGNIADIWLRQAEEGARKTNALRRALYYGNGLRPPDIQGKTVILVDDGIATGLSMEAAIHATRDAGAERIVVAVPIASRESIEQLKPIADSIVTLIDPDKFRGAVGGHYERFEEVTDQEVKALLWEVNHGISTPLTAPS